jgi:hypothetical protein
MDIQSQKLSKIINYYPVRDISSSPISSFIRNNITIWKTKRQLKQELLSPSVIFVYQMGKVGSLSLYLNIKDHITDQPIYHLHNLNPENSAQIWQEINLSKPYYEFTFGHSFTTKYLSEHINEIKQNKKIKIITGVRDPIARNISWFFQVIDCGAVFPSDFFRKFQEGSITMDDVIQKFWEQDFIYCKQFDWFELELKPVFNIDITSFDFPQEKGYTIVNFPDQNIELLVFKLEKLDSCVQEAMQTFLGIENINSKRYERTEFLEPHEYAIYDNLRKSLKFSNEYLDQIYDQPLVRHFYTDEEINAFKRKWSK